jgi:hypothetical protein
MANVPLIDEGTENGNATNENARHQAGHLVVAGAAGEATRSVAYCLNG